MAIKTKYRLSSSTKKTNTYLRTYKQMEISIKKRNIWILWLYMVLSLSLNGEQGVQENNES